MSAPPDQSADPSSRSPTQAADTSYPICGGDAPADNASAVFGNTGQAAGDALTGADLDFDVAALGPEIAGSTPSAGSGAGAEGVPHPPHDPLHPDWAPPAGDALDFESPGGTRTPPRPGGDLLPGAPLPPRRKPFFQRMREGWRDTVSDLRSLDQEAVHSLFVREALVTVRSRRWARMLAWFSACAVGLALLPGLYRTTPNHWTRPPDRFWGQMWTIAIGLLLFFLISGWSRRRIVGELRAGSLDEILLTGRRPAELMLGKALAVAGLAGLLTLAAVPGAVIATATSGQGPEAIVRIYMSLGLVAYLGLCFGMESAFGGQGGMTMAGFLWNIFYYFVFLLNALARMLNWWWLTSIRDFLVHYNPIAMLGSASGIHSERWAIAYSVNLLVAAVFTGANARLLRRELAHPGEASGGALNSLFGFHPRRKPSKKDQPPPPVPPYGDTEPVAELEARHGLVLRISLGLLVPIVGISVACLVIPRPEAGASLYALSLWLACLYTSQNACAAMAGERERARWEELALLPLSNPALTWEKLRYALLGWRVWGVLALLGIAQAALFGGPGRWAWAAWALVSGAVLPPAAAVVGALIALRAPAAVEAYWRTGLAVNGLPALVGIGAVAGVGLGPTAMLSPLVGAVLTIAGPLTPLCWIGTGAAIAAGVLAYGQLRSSLRELALAAT